MAGRRVHFVFPAELVDRVDAALGAGVSRGEWVRRAVERALGEQAGAPLPAPAEQPSVEPLGLSEDEIQREIAGDHRWTAGKASTPAEQPEEVVERPEDVAAALEFGTVPSSREFRPYPKGGKR